MSTMFPEAYADPIMQEMYEDEKGWGLPYSSFDIFMLHSVNGMLDLQKALGVKSHDHPFSWYDEEMHTAASTALLALRHKENLTDTQFAQLCWLEMSLMEEVCFLDDPQQLGKYASLVSEQQVKFVQGWNMRVDKEYGDEDADIVSTVVENVVELSPKLVKQTSDRVQTTINDFFSHEGEQKRKKVYERVLKYLKTIK